MTTETLDLGPLTARRAGGLVLVTLTHPDQPTLDVPPDYESFLRSYLEPILSDADIEHVRVDLRELPAISSRQLGLLIALQKALKPRRAKLTLTHVHPGVRRLLELSRTSSFFELE